MNISPYSDIELERLILEANERAHKGRFERLKYLLSLERSESYPVDSLAWEFYQEARLCWYVGAFVATIVMSCVALEELLCSKYRVIKGIGGCLDTGKKIDDAGFADLINQAHNDKLLTSKESFSLHRLRKNSRNLWVHQHDFDGSLPTEKAMKKPNWLMQDIKLKDSELVKKEASSAIRILVDVFPSVSKRFWGLK